MSRLFRFAASAAAVLALSAGPGLTQTTVPYRTPPAPIADILDAAPLPSVSVSPDRTALALFGRSNLPPIDELAAPMLRLAGYRLNPANDGPADSRVSWLTSLSFQPVSGGAVRSVALPQGARFTAPTWSPDGRSVAFVMRGDAGLELWAADVATATARRLTEAKVNAAAGADLEWLPDSSALAVRLVPSGRGPAPAGSAVPAGPNAEETSGRAAPVRTFQDLLQSAQDERLFEYHFTVQLAIVPRAGGAPRPVGTPSIVLDAEASPDGRFFLVTRVKRPFSRVVTAGRFPTEIDVVGLDGALVKRIADLPVADDVPPNFDAVRKGPRSVQWRQDRPATLVWAEAADDGDPRKASAVRDRVLTVDAPFAGAPTVLAELDARFSGVWWGRDDFALLRTRWWRDRSEQRFALNPARPGTKRLLVKRNYQDRYGDPGLPVLRTDGRGASLLHFTPGGRGLFMTGDGATPEGDYPFLSRMDLASGAAETLWRSEKGVYEDPVALLDLRGERLLTRRETKDAPPNYFVRARRGGTPVALTRFADPAPQFAGVTKRLIEYTRKDGVKLSGTLYLPAGYDARRDGRLPLVMWAYPTEFTDAAVAGQVQDTQNRFTRPGGASHLFLLTQGYAVLDDPSMPIVGANGAEANDTYVEQLVASAEAAVDAVVALGVADRERIAVGGHSYGAFMTANLLAHSDLFRTGVARSGAYNRTLTPFGFQAEERTYWQATDTYTAMSPFAFAHRVNEPILLIHGEADDNSGTFPVQTERFYAALKGNGATARYVTLPLEGHGYRARESVLHTLWETVTWLDRWMKPKAAAAD